MGLDDWHNGQDVDMNGVKLDAAGRLKRYTGSKMFSPARVIKKQLPKQFGIRSAPKRILNQNHETDERDLRVLLRYAADAWASKPLREHISNLEVLGPPRFVCLEAKKMTREELPIKFHVGVSIFDTGLLGPLQNGKMDPEKAVTSQHYLVHDPMFHPFRDRDFLYGSPKTVTDAEIAEKLRKLSSPPNILVTYGPKREHRALKKLGLDLTNTYIFDISNMALSLLDIPYAIPLHWLLQRLEIPFDPELLHVAGNDAHFALQAMLMMVALDAEKHPERRKVPAWVPTFKAIANAKLPDWDYETHMWTPAWFREQEDRLRQHRDVEHRIAEERYQEKKARRHHEELLLGNEDAKRDSKREKARAEYLESWRSTGGVAWV